MGSQRLPPCRNPVSGAAIASAEQGTPGSAKTSNPDGTVTELSPALTLDSHVRWVDDSAVRAMLSTDPETSEATVTLFHSCANDHSDHMCRDVEAEEEVGCLRFEGATFLPGLKTLLGTQDGRAVRCGDLPLSAEDDRVALCQNLVEAGVLE